MSAMVATPPNAPVTQAMAWGATSQGSAAATTPMFSSPAIRPPRMDSVNPKTEMRTSSRRLAGTRLSN